MWLIAVIFSPSTQARRLDTPSYFCEPTRGPELPMSYSPLLAYCCGVVWSLRLCYTRVSAMPRAMVALQWSRLFASAAVRSLHGRLIPGYGVRCVGVLSLCKEMTPHLGREIQGPTWN